ncbi:MAG: hypothetical protein WEB89_09160 [Balneolales bacterium]
MKIKTLPRTYILTLFFFPLLMTSCSDDPASSIDLEDAPEPPSLENVTMDLSIFESESNQKVAEMSSHEMSQILGNHDMAAMHATIVQQKFSSMAMLPSLFFNKNQWGQVDFKDDMFVWEYDQPFEGESASFLVTAQELSNGDIEWKLQVSANTEEQTIDDEIMLRTLVSADSQTGSWDVYNIEQSSGSVYRIEYEMVDDNPVRILLQDNASEGEHFEILYEANDPQYSILFINSDGQVYTELDWNIETGTGYFITDEYNEGEKSCWDEEYRDTDCQ